MKKAIIFTVIFLFFVSYSKTLSAENKQNAIRIAVVKITTNNCKESLGTAIEEMLMSRLFSTSLFTLMEKTQIDRITQRSGFKEFDISDKNQMIQLGRILKVDKIIIGSVSKIGDIKIEVRSIDVASGDVDISSSKSAANEGKIEKRINECADEIERFYLGYKKITGSFDIGFSGSFLIPFGKLSKYYSTAKGGYVSFYKNHFITESTTALICAGFYSASGNDGKINSIRMFPFELAIGQNFYISKSFTITPFAGAGMIYSKRKNEDRDENLRNLSLITRCEFSFFMVDRYAAFFSGGLITLPENDSWKYCADMRFGVKILF